MGAKSAIKAARRAEKRREANRTRRGALRTVLARAQQPSPDREAVLQAISALDEAARKGIIHPNAAARRKSRLAKRLNQLPPAAPTPASSSE